MKSTHHDLVSIVIPVYNGARYVGEAIESALAQTWPAIEVIVVDDGSNDAGATQRVIARYGDAVRVLAKRNGGVSSALNAGIAAMRGQWFCWLSHDDVYLPTKVADYMQAVRQAGGPAIAFGEIDFIDETGTVTQRGGLLRHWDGRTDDPRWLVLEGRLHGCAMLIPAECLPRSGAFDPGLPTTQDYARWFDLAERHPFVPVRAALVRARQHAGQDSRAGRHPEEAGLLWIRLLERMAQTDGASTTTLVPRLRRVQRYLRQVTYHGARSYVDARLRECLDGRAVALVCIAHSGTPPALALQVLAEAGGRCTELLLLNPDDDIASAQRWSDAAWPVPTQAAPLPASQAHPAGVLAMALARTSAETLVVIDPSAPVDVPTLREGLHALAAGEIDAWLCNTPPISWLGSLQGAALSRQAAEKAVAPGPQAFAMIGLRVRLRPARLDGSVEPEAPSAAAPAAPGVTRDATGHGALPLRTMPQAHRPTVLVLTPPPNRDTVRQARLLAASLGPRVNLLWGWQTGDQELHLSSVAPGAAEITYTLPRQWRELVADLCALFIARVNVMQPPDAAGDTAELLARLDRPYDVTLPEDAFFIPPAPEALRLVANADRVIASSREQSTLVVQRVQGAAVIAARLPEPGRPERFAPHPAPLADGEWMRVLYLGTSSPNPDVVMLTEVTHLLAQWQCPVRIECLGPLANDPALPADALSNPHLRLWGQCAPESLHMQICRIRPHLAWLPFATPPSHGFVLSDALLQGLPVLASGVGPTAERLHSRPMSWVLPPGQADARSFAEWLDRLQTERLSTPPFGPSLDHLPPLFDAFYPDAYLRPIGWPHR